MSIKDSKGASCLIIAIIYIAAFFVGYFVYKCPCMAEWHYLWRMLAADVAATIFVWFFGLLFKNVSVYDPYWSVAPPVMLTAWAVEQGNSSLSCILLLIAVWIWGIRLTGNWAYTFKNLNAEDWRYTKYRTNCSPFIFQLINFFGLNLMPTLVVFMVMIPGFKLIEMGGDANVFTFLAFLLCVGSASLQLVADHQIHCFIKEKRGRVCNVGLWKHGRHPNYLGEIMMWWGVYFMFLSVTPDIAHNWWWLIGAALNTCLFCFISIPLMEKRQLQNKPEYADYKKSTRTFV
ncbi:MAG: DUF1295 domain-containing protein [Bacteroidales bacterium]|nr:DUF1295 domain-containing protein [Bacteroidales bacterium]